MPAAHQGVVDGVVWIKEPFQLEVGKLLEVACCGEARAILS
jgi:hypothetical protein